VLKRVNARLRVLGPYRRVEPFLRGVANVAAERHLVPTWLGDALRPRPAPEAPTPVAAPVTEAAKPSQDALVDAANRDDALTIEIMGRVLGRESNAVDVGANIGAILEHIVRLAPAGKHYAFEPIPELADALRRRFPDVNTLQMALSDAKGESEFRHVKNANGYSGLKERNYDSVKPEIEILKVQIERLDDLLPPELPIHFLKADVEGGEYNAFRGALRTLKTWKPHMIFEHGRGSAEFYGVTPDMMYTLLADECGLAISTLEGWLENRAPLTRADLVRTFHEGTRWVFIAHPPRA
jgi:FkbM family methyltransferase